MLCLHTSTCVEKTCVFAQVSKNRPRNTSTYVEKTIRSSRWLHLRGKHLHVRGEDAGFRLAEKPDRETPPRTWRRHKPFRSMSFDTRNTSTYVEKTEQKSRTCANKEKHLHVRGEDLEKSLCRSTSAETPPRTWRRPPARAGRIPRFGNTSTYVEKTRLQEVQSVVFWKHLHVRGEDHRRQSVRR